MTDRNLGALLERASEHLPEIDFADGAWSDALAERARRRRLAVGTVAALAAAGLAVTAVQLGGSSHRTPAPAVSSTTTSATGTLADGTAFAQLPLEGKEAQLPDFAAGLPSVIDLNDRVVNLSAITKPLGSAVAVYLRTDGTGYRPVLVAPGGKQFLADRLLLTPTYDAGGNPLAPLGPRAVAGGRYVVFPQPGAVVRLDTHTGDVTRYAVPSKHVESTAWTPSNGLVVIRGDARVWTLDALDKDAKVKAVASTRYEGASRLRVTADTRSLGITTYDPASGEQVAQRAVTSPVTDLWGETVGSAQWTASGAFFDQSLTSPVIRRGNGPIYQGLVAVPLEAGKPRLLLAPENPDGQTGRFKGCCTVLGWADAQTVLFQTRGVHGQWVLAWNVRHGQVLKATRFVGIEPDGSRGPAGLALNVGWRY